MITGKLKNTLLFLWLVYFLLFGSCAKLPVDPSFAGNAVSHPSDSVLFAVIGDYGEDSEGEARVAALVKSWNPEFIVTTGDNNYPLGSAGTIKNNIGKHYGEYIYNPDAPADRRCQGPAATDTTNRFFPCPGNHDNYSIPPIKPYLDYFTLPGDERNYEFVWGPVHFFSLNTGMSGNVPDNVKQWLEDKVKHSNLPFKIIYFHHPPFSPGPHGSADNMRLPYADWGCDAVLSGHEHFYVRLKERMYAKPTYVIIGNSGNENLYNCNAHPLDSQRFDIFQCDNNHFGAIKVYGNSTRLTFEYYTTENPNTPADSFTLTK